MPIFAVVDVETTGLKSEYGHRVVELAAVILDSEFRVLRVFDSLVNPERSIPDEATEIHGVMSEHVREAPLFRDLIPELSACFSGVTHVVAHNASFDCGFIKAEFERATTQFPADIPTICTMKLAKLLSIAKNAKLATVASALQIPIFGDTHQAMVDAGLAACIYRILHEGFAPVESRTQWSESDCKYSAMIQQPRTSHMATLQQLASAGMSVSMGDGRFTPATLTSTVNQDLLRRLIEARSTRPNMTTQWNLRPETADGLQQPDQKMNDTATLTWHLLINEQQTVESIARQRGLTPGTIYLHLESALKCGVLEIHQIATPQQIERITETRRQLPDNETQLKPLYEKMNSELPYGLIRCVLTWQKQPRSSPQ